MTVYTKLLEAQKAVAGVAKGGRNEAQKYDFVRAVDVVKEGKRALNDADLVVYLGVSTQGFHVIERPNKSPMILYNVEGDLIVQDPEDGSSITVPVAGSGTSYGDEKGLYKAITGCWKYGFRTLLQIPDEKDDPEVETENDREVAGVAQVQTPRLATEAQRRMIRAKARDAGLSEDANFKAFVFASVGKRSSKEITQQDVEAMLRRLDDQDFVSQWVEAKEVVA